MFDDNSRKNGDSGRETSRSTVGLSMKLPRRAWSLSCVPSHGMLPAGLCLFRKNSPDFPCRNLDSPAVANSVSHVNDGICYDSFLLVASAPKLVRFVKCSDPRKCFIRRIFHQCLHSEKAGLSANVLGWFAAECKVSDG